MLSKSKPYSFDTMQIYKHSNRFDFFFISLFNVYVRLCAWNTHNHWGNHITKARKAREREKRMCTKLNIDWCRNSVYMCYVSCWWCRCCCCCCCCSGNVRTVAKISLLFPKTRHILAKALFAYRARFDFIIRSFFFHILLLHIVFVAISLTRSHWALTGWLPMAV